MMGAIVKVYSSKTIYDDGELPDIEEFSSFWYHIDYPAQILTCCNIVKLENYKREYPYAYLEHKTEYGGQHVIVIANAM